MQFVITSNIDKVRSNLREHFAKQHIAIILGMPRIVNNFAQDIITKGPEGVAGNYKHPRKQVLPNYKGTLVTGKISITAPHIVPVDDGFKSHGFPYKNIIPWIRKVSGETNPSKLRKKAYAAMIHIKKQGFKGHKLFETTTKKYSKLFPEYIFNLIRNVK